MVEKWSFVDPVALCRCLGPWNSGPAPLYEQLAAALTAVIGRGDLAPGSRLPSERRLARELSVSRGTVVSAYGVLREANLVRSVQGSGSVVAGSPPRARGRGELNLDALGLNVTASVDTRRDFVNLQAACWREASGIPAEMFEFHGDAVRQALQSHGYHWAGLFGLRAAVADYYSERSVATSPEQVLITSGAHQAIVLLTQMCAGPGDTVLSEELTYPGACDVFRTAGVRVVGAPLGPEGVRVDELDRLVRKGRPKLVYLIPTVHNPTGSVLPVEERQRLADLARNWDAVVVDDESLAETHLDGPPPSPITSFAQGADAVSRLFTVGSTSKSFWGGLRVGWIRGPQPAIAHLTRLKTLADLASPVPSQLVAQRLLERAPSVLAPRRAALRQRFATLTSALREHLPEWAWEQPPGGLALWVRLPTEEAGRFSELAARYGVGVVPGPVCSVGGAFGDHLRLGVGVSTDELQEGARRMAGAWHALMGDGAGPTTVEVIV